MNSLVLNTHIRGVVSNEDTFWSFLGENLEEAEALAVGELRTSLKDLISAKKPKVIIANSLLGDIEVPPGTKKVVLLQDNFISMQKLPFSWQRAVRTLLNFGKDIYKHQIILQKEALDNADVVVAVSKDVADAYGAVNARIIPIGTDPNLFSEKGNKDYLRRKYDLPVQKKINIFVGSTHPVKGFDILAKEIEKNQDEFYILVLKDRFLPRLRFKNAKVFHKVSQSVIAELHNTADLCVGRSRVETLWLGPIEAMFCGVPVDVTPVGIFRDWHPGNRDPRAEAMIAGLDRATMLARWQSLLRSWADIEELIGKDGCILFCVVVFESCLGVFNQFF